MYERNMYFPPTTHCPSLLVLHKELDEKEWVGVVWAEFKCKKLGVRESGGGVASSTIITACHTLLHTLNGTCNYTRSSHFTTLEQQESPDTNRSPSTCTYMHRQLSSMLCVGNCL